MQERKDRKALGLNEDYLYTENTHSVTYRDFINKELILFSNMDNERSIPSLVDGLKPGQRKVLFTCFKRNDKKEVKVAQLSGSVAEKSAYHHGEASLAGTIVNLAQNYVGSNNINLLQPIGQFGTRLQGGKDSASPRYIFTMLSPVTRTLFHQGDDPVMRYLREDNQRIEPEWYCPIIPTVLVNGAEGIGTGWSTKIHNYNPREIVGNLKRMLNDEPMQPMDPWFKNFRGTITRLDATRYVVSGEVAIVDNQTIEITELPIKVWTQSYKESVLEPMLGGEKQPQIIQDYKEYHTDTTVKFVVKLKENDLARLEEQGLHKAFKLQNTISLGSMVLFDPDGVLRRYDSVEQIMEDFIKTRRKIYHARKEYLEGMLKAEAKRLSNQARFILEKIEGTIKIENKKKKVIVQQLVDRKYDPDPVKTWKEERRKLEEAKGGDAEEETEGEDGGEAEAEAETVQPEENELATRMADFDYLVNMALIKLSEEEKDKLLKLRDEKLREQHIMESTTITELWTEDLDNFVKELDKQEEKERTDEASTKGMTGGKSGKGKGAAGGRLGQKPKQPKMTLAETQPTPKGVRVEPRIDAALKAKFENADRVKENKGMGKGRKKTAAAKKEENGVDDDDDLDNSSLLERIAKKSPDVAKIARKKEPGAGIVKFLTSNKKTEKKGEDVTDLTDSAEGTKKKAQAGTKRKATSSPAKKKGGTKKKKKEEWETDSEESDDPGPDVYNITDSGEDLEEDDMFQQKEKPKQTAPKRTAAKKKPTAKTIESDEDMEGDDLGRDPTPTVTEKSDTPKKTKPAKAPRKIDSDSDDEGASSRPGSTKGSSKAKSKSPSPVPLRERVGRAKKPVKYNFEEEEESDPEPSQESDDSFKDESD